MTTQTYLSHYLHTHCTRVTSLAPLLFKFSKGADAHQVRVATRRIQAAFWILKHDNNALDSANKLSNDKFMALKKQSCQLKKLSKALGKIRDLDIALADAKNYNINSTDLKNARAVAHDEIRIFLSPSKQKQLKREFQSAEQLALTTLPETIDRARRHLRFKLSKLQKQKKHGAKKLHQLRIKMRKARYILEALGEPIRPLKPLQDVLGEIHDTDILQNLVGKNVKLKSKSTRLNKKAIALVKPALSFAVMQLESRHARSMSFKPKGFDSSPEQS